MSSIRPLITITILVIAGAWLLTKINDGPPLPHAAVTDAPAAPTGIPALSVNPPNMPSTGAADLTAAAPWNGNATNGATAPTLQPANSAAPSNLSGVASAGTPALPEVPSIPALPPLPSAPGGAEAATSATPSPITLPAEIPTARYPDANSPASSGVTDSLTPMNPTSTAPSGPSLGANGPAASAPDADRYGAAASTEPASSSFATSWPDIQAALARQELAKAHQMLSQWYENPSLSSTEAQQVQTLLNQLAGTVVYSTEHRLEPPYVVRAGDTLQSIADQYDVPWQLLAKINGIPAADLVRPGQEIKVVHGPFSAIVALDKQELTLMLDGRYAGRFSIATESAAATSEGQWVVEQKLANPTASPLGMSAGAIRAPTNSIDRVLVLRNSSPLASGAAISITSGPATPSGPTAVAPVALRMAPRDADEIADILSIGSRVTIRR